MYTLDDKIQYAIQMMQDTLPIATKFNGQYGHVVAYSGGKDSEVCIKLAQLANVPTTIAYSNTTIDNPQNIYFIRKQHPDTIFLNPKMNFFQILKYKNQLPTVNRRFCCDFLKEQNRLSPVNITGIRHEESFKRSKTLELSVRISAHSHNQREQRNYFDSLPYNYKHTLPLLQNTKFNKNRCLNINPILQWNEIDIYNFIDKFNITLNPEYTSGQPRVGCIFCPCKTQKQLILNSKLFPKHFKILLNTIQHMINNGFMNDIKPTPTPYQIFLWWTSKKPTSTFFNNQTSIFNL